MFHKPIITEIPILKWYKGVDKPVDKAITPISDRGVKMDEKLIVYRVGFNDGDETEVDARSETEAIELAKTIATESGVGFELDYVESCGFVDVAQ